MIYCQILILNEMNRVEKYMVNPLLLCILLTIGCKEEGLSETEILQMARQSNFAVRILEQGINKPVADVEVTLFINKAIVSATTDEAGMAYFTSVEQGDVMANAQKEGYFELNQRITIHADGRAGFSERTLQLYSKEATALIAGIVEAQTDLTTEAYENPEGIIITALHAAEVLTSAKTDDKGRYRLLIPTSPSGRRVRIKFPDFIHDQKIAIRGTGGVEIKTAKGTIFRPYEKAQELPNTANILATLPPPAIGGDQTRQDYVRSLTVQAGVITGIELHETGYGYDRRWYWVSVASAEGGSGASIRLFGELNTTEYCRFPEYYRIDPGSLTIFSGGSGYSDYEPNQNFPTTHPTGFAWDSRGCNKLTSSSQIIKSGETYRIDVNYGTGTVIGEIE